MAGTDLIAAIDALRRQDYAAARRHMAAHAAAHEFDQRAYQAQGLAELAMQDWTAARLTFTAACRRFPDTATNWLNLGQACEQLGLRDEAVAAYEQALARDTAQAETCGNLANLYRLLHRHAEAEAMARRALAAGADRAQALNSLALALGKQGKFVAAETALAEALTLAPQDAALYANAANLAVDQLHMDEAWPRFAAARKLDDRVIFRHDEGLARLLAGDMVKGWPLLEARLDLPRALRSQPPFPCWQGEDIKGKRLLLVAEQGFGDTIQFCRYGKQLQARGARLIWRVPQVLHRLLAANLPGQVTSETEPMPEADIWAPLMSLPLLMGEMQPQGAPYLHASSEPRLPASAASPVIGLVWAGSPTHERDHERSIPLRDLAPLWQNRSARYVAPFKGRGLEEITPETAIERCDDLIKDFADSAALIRQLDCLVTVDTAAAHLASALGVRTLLLLPFCPDWRWGISGETTPWYDSVTLLRQKTYGDWGSVIAEAVRRLPR